MKNNLKQSKRSSSPMHPKTIELSQKKKKVSINSNNVVQNTKQVQGIYGKTERKKSNLSKQSINRYQNTKYRIVTQPVQHFEKIQHLVNGNIFNNSSFTRIPIDRKKNESIENNQKKVKINFKNPNQNLKSLSRQKIIQQCKYCSINQQIINNLTNQLEFIKTQIQNITHIQIGWKQGKITLQNAKNQLIPKNRLISVTKSVHQHLSKNQDSYKISFHELKQNIIQFMNDIQSLSKIDFTKMVQSDIFSYEIYETNDTQIKIQEAKSLLHELKQQYFGINTYNLINNQNQNEHNELMLRNLKSRLSQSLRQNLEMKVKKQLFLRASQIKGEQDDYIKKIIREVLFKY